MQIGVDNLRRLRLDPITLRPLTILVGQNSSGKSTFLRMLPLFRQSMSTRTSSPVLWYGEFVDFGDFKEAVYKHDLKQKMTFTFGLSRVDLDFFDYYYDDAVPFRDEDNYIELKLRVVIGSGETGTRIYTLLLNDLLNGSEYRLDVDSKGSVERISLDGEDFGSLFEDFNLRLTLGTLLPSLQVERKADVSAPSQRALGELSTQTAAAQAIASLVSDLLDKRTKADTLARLVRPLFSMLKIDQHEFMAAAERATNVSWRKLLRRAGSNDRDQIAARLRRLILLGQFSTKLHAVAASLEAQLRSTLYIGPARAKSDRYYRYQDLNVAEIDPNGINFPMFLNSLQRVELEAFSKWVRAIFGFGVELKESDGHISIHLIYGAESVNVADTGYGASQILPVLGQIWWATNKPSISPFPLKSPTSQFIAIEQPELHLHPAHQALLADMFVGAVSEQKDRHLCFIVETHSETMINRLGSLVADGKVSPDTIEIIIFAEDPDDDMRARAASSRFQSDGTLIDWPYGFFLPSI